MSNVNAEYLKQAIVDFRDVVLNQRGAIAENGMTNDQINDVLNEFDYYFDDIKYSIPSADTITLPITEYEQLMAIKKAACIYVREEVNWEDAVLHEEGGDEKAMEWFVNEYSEHNYG
jgi:hypothetical protein